MKNCWRIRCLLAVCAIPGVANLSSALAQTSSQDSLLQQNLPKVTITATRNARPLDNLPLPVSIIPQEQIRGAGSLRLNDVLAEQTGLAIVSDHGTGLQMQGFNPEYTLILLDGEPLIGRTAGTLELSRIAVGNIEKIEIVKGPSSSLYGSEALAGVVNIITKKPQNQGIADLSLRYGANRTADLGFNYDVLGKKIGLSLFANRYQSAGYDLDPTTPVMTVDPFSNHTLQSRMTWKTGKKSQLSLSGRWFGEGQDQFVVLNTAAADPSPAVRGEGKVQDWNLLPIWNWYPHKKLSLQFRNYYSQYGTESELRYDNGELYDQSFFKQRFIRPEGVATYQFLSNHTLTTGVGQVYEQVAAIRYEDVESFQTTYGFAQYEWLPQGKIGLTTGLRYDRHSVYGAQVSPKLGLQWNFNPTFRLNASVGRGFKSPDFRQLYLNFTNTVAGYTVLGAAELRSGLSRLQEQGQILDLFMDAATFGEIRPESSTAYNLGWRWMPVTQVKFSGNLFYNAVKDLIQTQAVARKTNGQSVFSYFNINQVFTRGLEADVSWQLKSWLSLNVGYQYLEAKDRAVLQRFERGEVFRRDPATLNTERVPRSDYGGLFNRSRHMANLRLFFNHEASGYSGSLRLIYRGPYGFADRNANGVLDAANEYVNGYSLLNLAAAKTLLQQQLRLQLGLDNALNYRDPDFIPVLPGRIWFVSLGYHFSKK